MVRPAAPLLAHVARWRWHLLLCVALILAATVALACVVRPKFTATSSLLVLLGSEYTVRGNAGEALLPAGSPDHEQILRTEAEILQSDALQRAVIRAVGLQAMYPEFLEPPGLFHQALHALSAIGGSDRPAPDPVDLARLSFDRSFSATVLKQGDALELQFSHPDPVIAARVLNTLVALYLDRRRQLYEDGQLAPVEAQVRQLRARLAAAEAELTAFEADEAVSSFDTRRDILLHAQGDAEREQAEAASQLNQQEARWRQLRADLMQTPEFVRQGDDVETEARVSDLRASLDGLRAKLAAARASYRDDSSVVRALLAQIAAREAELDGALRNRAPTTLHRARNPVWETLQTEALHAAAELSAATARRDHAGQRLVEARDALTALVALEQRFRSLQRQRDAAEDDSKAAARILADREMVEGVAAAKRASVRQIAPAAVPVRPKPTRLLILIGGFSASLLVACGLALVSNLLRGVYLLPAELEADLGVTVLTIVPDLPAEQARVLVLAPVSA